MIFRWFPFAVNLVYEQDASNLLHFYHSQGPEIEDQKLNMLKGISLPDADKQR